MIKFVTIDNNTNMVLSIRDYKTDNSITVNESDYSYKDGYGKYLIKGKLVDIADSDTATRQAIIDKINSTKNKKVLLDKLMVTTKSGKVFYADPISRSDMSDAIAIATAKNITSTTWKLAVPVNGSKFVTVDISELEEARELSLVEKGKIIGV